MKKSEEHENEEASAASEAMLDDLDKLLARGRELVSEQRYSFKGLSDKNFMVLMCYAVTHNYTEALVSLCRNKKVEAASVLLRSVFESSVKTQYVLEGQGPRRRFALFAAGSAINKRRVAYGLLDFLKRRPELEGTDELLSRPLLEALIEKQDADLKIVADKFGDTELPTLLEMARALDGEAANWEYTYHVMYRHLSPYAHLDAEGIDHFINKSSAGGFTLLLSESEKDGSHLILTAYVIYLSLLLKLREHRLIPNDTRFENEEVVSQRFLGG